MGSELWIQSSTKIFLFKHCLPVSVSRCKVMHKWHDWCICSDSFIYCCFTSVWMEEFLRGIFKCNFLSLQLSSAEFTYISAFGLLFSTEKSDSRAAHLTAVYIFSQHRNNIFFLIINKYFDLAFLCFFSCSSLPSFFPISSSLMLTISWSKGIHFFSAFVCAKNLAISIGAALNVISLLKP